jgi:hypothetical protein
MERKPMEREAMRTRLTLRPGDRGTKKLLERYGDRLLCVRYRYDGGSGRRIKTAEIIVDETEMEPAVAPVPPCGRRFISVGIDEWDIRDRVKRAGGRWHPAERAWSLPYGQIAALGLTDRLVEGLVPDGSAGASGRSSPVDAL